MPRTRTLASSLSSCCAMGRTTGARYVFPDMVMAVKLPRTVLEEL